VEVQRRDLVAWVVRHFDPDPVPLDSMGWVQSIIETSATDREAGRQLYYAIDASLESGSIDLDEDHIVQIRKNLRRVHEACEDLLSLVEDPL
jgi:hypothetical protein